MKTAISLPRDVFERAERLAKRTHKSRSQLYREALSEYVARHSVDDVSEALDRALEGIGEADDRFVRAATARRLASVEW